MRWNEHDISELNQLFYKMVSIQSDTGTIMETAVSDYIFDEMKRWTYFKKHPSFIGKHSVANDPHGRCVVWALIKMAPETVVLMNHHDVVDIDEYGDMKEFALKPEALKEHLVKKLVSKEVEDDFNDDEWIFGRGTADMKAGIALQMMMIKKISDMLSKEGNIQSEARSLLFLSVCDEENLSAGMREAVSLMSEMSVEHELEYVTAINSEPYMKENGAAPIIYEGSVGKTMAVVLARGKKAHVGNVFEGINPTFLLSRIQMDVELNPAFSDSVEGEVSPPPTFVYSRDQKKMYDASIPESAAGYFSLLTLTMTASEILRKLVDISQNAFEDCIDRFNESYREISDKSNHPLIKADLKPRVMTYSSLIDHLTVLKGYDFLVEFNSALEDISKEISEGKLTLQRATLKAMEMAVSYIPDNEPIILIGLCGPVYPQIRTSQQTLRKTEGSALKIINTYAEEHGLVQYERRNYFMGICDFSYLGFQMQDSEIEAIEQNMPGFGKFYTVPLDLMKHFDMELINLGPWGKDLHKTTERVYKPDLVFNTPNLMLHLLQSRLKMGK